MRAEIDCRSIPPDQFAGQVGAWLESTTGKNTKEMQEAHKSAAAALHDAAALGRSELFAALAPQNGDAAMEVAARVGLSGAIRELAQAGVDVNGSPQSKGFTPLIIAAGQGHADAVVALLECGADISKHIAGTNALAMAIMKEKSAVAQVILERVGDLSGFQHVGGNLLHVAAQSGCDGDIVARLVEHGVAPDACDHFQRSPIAMAAELGHAKVVRALAAAGASTELPPRKSAKSGSQFEVSWPRNPPLVLAAKNAHADAVSALLEAGAALDAKDSEALTAYDWARKNGHTAIAAQLRAALNLAEQMLDGHDLIAAARHGDVDGIRRALACGVKVDFRDQPTRNEYHSELPGRTALMWAAVEGHVAAARVLIEAGASAESQEPDAVGPASAWELAAQHNHAEVLSVLFELCRNPGKKLLGLALYRAGGADSAEAIDRLIDGGVNVDSRVTGQRTPLMTAAAHGHPRAVERLLARGANVELRDSGMFSGTALREAVSGLSCRRETVDEKGRRVLRPTTEESVACIRLLLAAGADANAVARHGNTLLQDAADCPEAVRLLLEAGSDPSLADTVYGATALHWATMNHNAESVRLLLDAGADVMAIDAKGLTPLDCARNRKLKKIRAMLEEAGGASGTATRKGQAVKHALAQSEQQEQQRQRKAAEADERLRPDFNSAEKSPNFRKAVARLEKLCGTSSTNDKNVPGIAYCTVPLNKANELIERERNAFLRLKCTLFRCGRAHSPDDDELLAILPTTDPLQVVAAIGTSAPNYGLFMSDIVDGLKRLQLLEPLRILKVSYDTVELEFHAGVDDPRTMAKHLYEFCPDVVDQGFGSIGKLQKHLAAGRNVTLWWD
ncbi:MAG: ankyrin repeat domain-containing protein [Pirellulales bacterium]